MNGTLELGMPEQEIEALDYDIIFSSNDHDFLATWCTNSLFSTGICPYHLLTLVASNFVKLS